MNDMNKERLYEIYLASLKSGVEDIPESEMQEINLPEDENFSFEDNRVVFTEAEGNIIVVEAGKYEIWCLILEQAPHGMFQAYKISPFTAFASEYDLLIRAGSSIYLLEMDNSFLLSSDEVREGIPISAVDEEVFIAIKAQLQQSRAQASLKNTDLKHPDNLFRILEHEQTLGLRSRQVSAPLWIPQISLQYEREAAAVIPAAAADIGVAGAFEVLRRQQDENVYFAKEYTLHKNERHELILSPDQGYVSQKAEVRCGDIVVFRGILPESLILASFLPVSTLKAQRFLDINLKTIKE